jgi:hypothetical protein
MSGSHRKSLRRRQRRHATLATGAFIATASVGLAPTAQAAAPSTQLDPLQSAENDYQTSQNVAQIESSLGSIQGSVLNPISKVAPQGWLPTSTNTGYTSTTTSLSYLNALGRTASMIAAQPDLSGVPGGTTLGSAALLPAQIAQAVPLASPVAGGAAAVLQTTGAITALQGINVEIGAANTLNAGLSSLYSGLNIPIVEPQSPLITGIPSLNDVLPQATETTSSWSNNFAWPVLDIAANSWSTSDQLVVPGVTTQDIADQFDLTVPGPVTSTTPVYGTVNVPTQVPNYTLQVVQTGSHQVWVPPVTLFGHVITPGFWKTIPDYSTELLPDGTYTTVNVPTIEQTGTTTSTLLTPQDQVNSALGLLNGINVPGYTITKTSTGSDVTLPGDGALGWTYQSTTVDVKSTDGSPDQVSTVPVVAAGFAAPFGLLTTGALYSPGVVTQSGQSTNTTLGSHSFDLSSPILNSGIQTTSLLESSHVGPDGVSYNSGWTVALINVGGTTIPLVYSLGSANVGPNGVGYTSPSFFGVGLPSFQLGTPPGGSSAGGNVLSSIGNISLPTSVIALDPKTVFSALGITDPTGLGLTDPFGTAQSTLSPLFTKLVTPVATPVWQAGANVAVQVANTANGEAPKVTGQLAQGTGTVADNTEQVSTKVAPAIPQAPPSKLDGTSIKPGVQAAGQAITAAGTAVGKVGAAGNNAVSGISNGVKGLGQGGQSGTSTQSRGFSGSSAGGAAGGGAAGGGSAGGSGGGASSGGGGAG